MHAETDRVVNPSESASNINCYYYGGSFLKDINHYNVVEPDIATIKYIDEGKILTAYYDYSSKKYSAKAETEIAYQWSQIDLGSKIPKLDVKVVESDRDDEIIFMFGIRLVIGSSLMLMSMNEKGLDIRLSREVLKASI